MDETRRVAVFFTGGTIGMSPAPGVQGVSPGGNFDKLFEDLSPSTGGVTLTPVLWADKPSPHMHPEDMIRLSGDVDQVLTEDGVMGAVILHGTDVLVETAFMLDLCLASRKPVVVTGSMRYYTESGYDGLRNLINAVRAVSLPLPREAGVAVLMTDRLFSARDVVKVNSLNVDAFEAREDGVLGFVAGDRVVLSDRAYSMSPLPRFGSGRINGNVHLLTCYTGMDGTLIRSLRESGMEGLVLEGFGAGNVPPGVVDEVALCLGSGMPVVLATRCIEGGVWPIYGYRGGAAQMREMGVILSGRLGGAKSRILLMAALAETSNPERIRSFFRLQERSA